MFGWLANLFGSSRPAPLRTVYVQDRRGLRGAYDAAQTTDDNRRHWANADDLSARAANSPAVRRALRRRCRYEVANNSYARGIVSTLANDCIGTGPRLQLLTEDPAANKRIERAFTDWSRAIGLPQKLRTLRMAKAQDGEAFALLVTNPRLPTPITLDLRLIEADQVTSPSRLDAAEHPVDGIDIDSLGNPLRYYLLDQHPGDASWLLPFAARPVEAASVLHLFTATRPGQARGIPELTPALELFAQLRRFTLATLAAAETAADFAAILTADAAAGEAAEIEGDPWATIEIEKRGLMTTPEGWRVAQLKAEHPSTTYAEFKREIINEIARCLNMPFNVAAGNSSSYNYASGRLDHQTYYKAVRVEQAHLEAVVLDRLFRGWLDEAALIPGLIPDGIGPFSGWDHRWFWDGTAHVDPLKEANAAVVLRDAGLLTEAEYFGEQGLDWEAQHVQLEMERASRVARGIANGREDAETYGMAVRAGAVTPQVEDEEAIRTQLHLPPVGQAARAAWKQAGGVRSPITLDNETPPPSARKFSPKEDEDDDAEETANA